jgi:hypothetical protein
MGGTYSSAKSPKQEEIRGPDNQPAIEEDVTMPENEQPTDVKENFLGFRGSQDDIHQFINSIQSPDGVPLPQEITRQINLIGDNLPSIYQRVQERRKVREAENFTSFSKNFQDWKTKMSKGRKIRTLNAIENQFTQHNLGVLYYCLFDNQDSNDVFKEEIDKANNNSTEVVEAGEAVDEASEQNTQFEDQPSVEQQSEGEQQQQQPVEHEQQQQQQQPVEHDEQQKPEVEQQPVKLEGAEEQQLPPAEEPNKKQPIDQEPSENNLKQSEQPLSTVAPLDNHVANNVQKGAGRKRRKSKKKKRTQVKKRSARKSKKKR